MKNVEKDCPFCYKSFSNETLRKHIGIVHLGLSIQDFVPAQTDEKKNTNEASIACISLVVTIKQENPSPPPEPKKTKERELKILLKRLSTKDIEKLTGDKTEVIESTDPLLEMSICAAFWSISFDLVKHKRHSKPQAKNLFFSLPKNTAVYYSQIHRRVYLLNLH